MSTDIDDAFHEDFAARWGAAWNSHDTQEVLNLVHPDITWDDRTFWPEIIHGIDELREYVDKIWEAMPDVQFEEIERFVSPDRQRGLFLFRQYGTAPERLAVDGTYDVHGCDIFLEFTDGLLSQYLASYDIDEMMRQMGALPEREGRLGGAYLMSLLHRPAPDAHIG